MGIIILLIIYLVILIYQIIFFMRAIKSKNKEYWIKLIKIEICSILMVPVILLFLDSLPKDNFMPGFSYLGEALLSFGSAIMYAVMLFITICTKIIIFEKHNKQQEKKYTNPIILIIALIFIFIGSAYFISEISYNFGKKETIATIVGYREIRDDYKWTIVSFMVDGKEYKDDTYSFEGEIGDKVKGYYYLSGGGYTIQPHIANYKKIYIPTLTIGILLIVWRFKDNILQGKRESK